MQCEFKKSDQPKFCKLINGECQFLKNGFETGEICPFRLNYDINQIQENLNSKTTQKTQDQK